MSEHGDGSQRRTRRGMRLRRRDVVNLLLLLAIVGVVSSRLIHSSGGPTAPGGASTTRTALYEGLTVSDPREAPPLVLDNYLGGRVNLDNYRGRAVLVTFLYTHCPDICPLITSKLHTALGEMSGAERRRVAIIAVSVDPRGDTPSTVAQFLADHGMTGRMKYLIGSASALARVWSRWGIGSERDAADPALVAHTALVYGINARGRIVTTYTSSFAPEQVVHDVRLLASS